MTNPAVGLAAAITALRAELVKAMDVGEGEPVRFRLAPVELTLRVEVAKEASGKIGWSVLGAGVSVDAATSQTIKLRLEPVGRKADGSFDSDFLVTDQTAREPSFGPRPDTGKAG